MTSLSSRPGMPPPGWRANNGLYLAWRGPACRKAPLMSPRHMVHFLELNTWSTSARASWLSVGLWQRPLSIFSLKSGSKCPWRHHLALILVSWSSVFSVMTERLPMNLSGYFSRSILAFAPVHTLTAGLSLRVDHSVRLASSILGWSSGELPEGGNSFWRRFCKKADIKTSAVGIPSEHAMRTSSENKPSDDSWSILGLDGAGTSPSVLASRFRLVPLGLDECIIWSGESTAASGATIWGTISCIISRKSSCFISGGLNNTSWACFEEYLLRTGPHEELLATSGAGSPSPSAGAGGPLLGADGNGSETLVCLCWNISAADWAPAGTVSTGCRMGCSSCSGSGGIDWPTMSVNWLLGNCPWEFCYGFFFGWGMT